MREVGVVSYFRQTFLMSGFKGAGWILTALSAFHLLQAVVLAEACEESLVLCRDRVGRERNILLLFQ